MSKGSSLYSVVEYPAHYVEGRRIEPLEAITDWDLPYHLGNVVKYVSRAGRKGSALEDLRKARMYLERYITLLEQNRRPNHE